MPNITLAVPADVLRAARIRAAEQGTSVSGLVREFLTSLTGAEDEFDRLKHRGPRPRWLSGPWLADQLATRSADPGLTAELDEMVGHTVDEL